MTSWHRIGLLAIILTTVLVLPIAASSSGNVIHFSSLDSSQAYQLSGTLYLPANVTGPCPAVVVIHGTAGIDSRGAFYRDALLNAGIAMFEVDFKTGIFTSPMNRPPLDTFVPMAFAALKELRKQPNIDPNRIAIMGFSLGGGVTLRTALEDNRKQWMGEEKGFIAHVAFYPVSKPFIVKLKIGGSKLTGSPIIILYGTEDSYGEGKAVPELKALLASRYGFTLITVEYPGATHGFNRDGPALSYADPAAIGGKGYMAWNPEAANDSKTRVLDFLKENVATK